MKLIPFLLISGRLTPIDTSINSNKGGTVGRQAGCEASCLLYKAEKSSNSQTDQSEVICRQLSSSTQ